MSEAQGDDALRMTIANTIEARIIKHRSDVVGGLVEGQFNILAEGDSWFDYPFGQRSDLLAFLPKQFHAPRPQPVVLSLAHYGDAATQMLGRPQRDRLERVLTDPSLGPFDVILFSGGGNDVAGEIMSQWLNRAATPDADIAGAVNLAEFAKRLGQVEAAFRDLIALRNRHAMGVPIIVNAYDFALPTNTSVCDGAVGPWLYPSLHARGWMNGLSQDQLDRGSVIVRALLDHFHDMLLRLSEEPGSLFHIAETRGTLTAADWVNELHPTPKGAIKLARKFREAIDGALAARLTS